MDRADDLRADYDELGRKLQEAEGSAAAAIVRERRLISQELEQLEQSKEVVALVDQLAERRAASGASRVPTRRRKSG